MEQIPLPPPCPPKKPGDSFFNSLTLKVLLIGICILTLFIPVGMISNLIHERSLTADNAIEEVGRKWSGTQQITGPVLDIPYWVYIVNEKKEIKSEPRHLYILPETLRINGTVDTKELKRGIFDIVVYNSPLVLSGTFDLNALLPDNLHAKDLLLSEARLLIGISDLRGITEQVRGTWDKTDLIFDAGIDSRLLLSGISCPVHISFDEKESRPLPFSIDLRMKGSEALLFTPLGKTTTVDLASNCPSPGFDGAFLPEKRELSEDGFTAAWKIQHLNRNYPQAFTGESRAENLQESAFGVNLLLPVDQYQKSLRSVKYAFLIIILTFVVCFFVETLQKKNISPFQYLLIGLALCLFYTLLISISEHLGFTVAYLVSAIMTIGLLTAYLAGILKIRKTAFTIGALLAALYTYIFMLIQMEKYALLAGSLGLFAILAVIMYCSLQIKWDGKR